MNTTPTPKNRNFINKTGRFFFARRFQPALIGVRQTLINNTHYKYGKSTYQITNRLCNRGKEQPHQKAGC
jgi:hypothetical protein